MAKVSYANLKLKVNVPVKTFDFNGTEIEVVQYLPMMDKNDLIMITLQKAEENGVYNPMLIDMHFHLNLVYMYTNLSFTEKQREDEAKLYDTLRSNNFFELFLHVLAENEYQELFNYINEVMKLNLNYRNTAGAVLQSLIQDLPRNAEAAAQIVNSFDKEKYQEVINFATAANGGRNIKTNQ